MRRVAAHLRGLGLKFELLVVDEGSGDNTVAVVALLRGTHPELTLHHAGPGLGFVAGAERARGRTVIVCDVRADAPLAAVGWGLSRLDRGLDAVAIGGRLLFFRRARALRALDSLAGRRDFRDLERRFIRRARALGLPVSVTHPKRQRLLDRLRAVIPVPAYLL